ncbi:hypothetical protein CO666_22290 [Rhizobium chutanense]|uniref:Uncharacterized protein n=1 Tax=Rhizobium chutanense TaxID=2035448 RepID=A0A2A6J869_9HYPH|nr:hypothetical protein CO666_22290 [Rhizobium chutanense]
MSRTLFGLADREHLRRNGNADLPGSAEVDDQFRLFDPFNGQVAGLAPLGIRSTIQAICRAAAARLVP